MTQAAVVGSLVRRLPFFYGWVILACVCLASIARTGPAVATLSLFVEPMTGEFGWSRTALSGAVSLGGVLAALSSPYIGGLLDRSGPRLILCVAVITTSVTILLLSQINSLVAFYALFCIARLNFAGPFDLGIYGAVSNWFVARRALATSLVTLAGMAGLVIMPLIGYFAMQSHGWRGGWLAVGTAVLVIGLLPCWLLLVRRPEDLGLLPDGAVAATAASDADAARAKAAPAEEPDFTRGEAMRTRAFWMLALFTAMVYPVQAGVSLHQAAHLVESGLSPAIVVSTVTVFSLGSAALGLAFGGLIRWIGVRASLVLTGAFLAAGAGIMATVATPTQAMIAATLFGMGVGGMHTVLPVAWADYFGRKNYGAIRGVSLTIQVTAQAAGPLLSGVLRDVSGNYLLSLGCFTAFACLSMLAGLLVKAPAALRRH